MENFTFYTGEDNLQIWCQSIGLIYNHYTMDMSVANSSSRERLLILSGQKKYPVFTEDWCGCGKTQINEVADKYVALTWRGMDYKAYLGETCKTKTVYLDNPYLSREEVMMEYEYSVIEIVNGCLWLLEEIRNEHKESPGRIGGSYVEVCHREWL